MHERGIIMSDMLDKSIDWLEAGVIVLGRNGKLELNSICKEIGKSKSSFYNIYPNTTLSRGFERFENDLFEHIYTVLNNCYADVSRLMNLYPFPQIMEKIVHHINEPYDYLKCVSQIRRLRHENKKYEEHFNRLNDLKVDVIQRVAFRYFRKEESPVKEIFYRTLIKNSYDGYLNYSKDLWIEESMKLVKLRLYMQVLDDPIDWEAKNVKLHKVKWKLRTV